MHCLPLGTRREFKCCSAIASETPFTTPTPKVPNPKAGKVWTRETSFVQRYMTEWCMSSLKLSFSCCHPAAKTIHLASTRKKTNIPNSTHLREKRQWIFKSVKLTKEKKVQSWLELSKILPAVTIYPEPQSRVPATLSRSPAQIRMWLVHIFLARGLKTGSHLHAQTQIFPV